MLLNIFRVDDDAVEPLRRNLTEHSMSIIGTVTQDQWSGDFYFSKNPAPTKIGWIDPFLQFFGDEEVPQNRSHYGAFMFTSESACYVLSYGASHFYIRPYCDLDFGIELGKRIANDLQTAQTSSRRFQGKRKKDIRSYAPDTPLDPESGESVEYLKASIIAEDVARLGKSGEFGNSVT